MTDTERQILRNQFGIMMVVSNLIMNLLPRDSTKIGDGENAMDLFVEEIRNTADLLEEDREELREAAIRERMKNRG